MKSVTPELKEEELWQQQQQSAIIAAANDNDPTSNCAAADVDDVLFYIHDPILEIERYHSFQPFMVAAVCFLLRQLICFYMF